MLCLATVDTRLISIALVLRLAAAPLLLMRLCFAHDAWRSKSAFGQAAALRWSGLRFAPTTRCSVLRPRRRTHYARFARCVQTAAASQSSTALRAGAASPALLGAPEARCSPPERAFAGCFVCPRREAADRQDSRGNRAKSARHPPFADDARPRVRRTRQGRDCPRHDPDPRRPQRRAGAGANSVRRKMLLGVADDVGYRFATRWSSQARGSNSSWRVGSSSIDASGVGRYAESWQRSALSRHLRQPSDGKPASRHAGSSFVFQNSR